MFYDIYRQLCLDRGISVSRAAQEIGIHKSAVSHWKKTGSRPSPDVLLRIAEYFHVSADSLLDLPTQGRAMVTDADLKRALFGREDVPDALLQEVRDYAAFLLVRRGLG